MEKRSRTADESDAAGIGKGSLPRNEGEPLADSKEDLESLPGAVIVTDKAGQPIRFNRSAIHLLGSVPHRTRPEDWPKRFGIYLQDGKTQYPEKKFPLLRALRGENVEPEEIIFFGSDNHPGRWLSMSARPLLSPKGKVSGALLVLNDITSQKRAEMSHEKQVKRIEASYALSKQIAKIGNDPLQILNTVVEFVSEVVGDGCAASLINQPKDKMRIITYHHHTPRGRELLQQSMVTREYVLEGVVEKVINTGEPILIPSVDQDRLRQLARAEQIPYIDEIGVKSLLVAPIKGRNGVLGTLSLFRDNHSEPYTAEDQSYVMDVAYRTGLAIDTTSLVHSLRVESSVRRIAEEALELSEVRFRSIFTSTALGIKLLDLDGNILETNPAFQTTLGYNEEELKGKPIVTLWHPADAKLLNQLLEKLKTDRVQSFQLEHRLLAKDGSTVWFNVTFSGLKKNERDESLAYIVAIAENITKRKRMEAEMAEMKSRLHSHVEMERLQLAQELHDGPLQDLYSAIYKIESWGNKMDHESGEKVEALKRDLLDVIHELRNTAKNLRPPALTNFGLEKAIRSHAEEFGESHPDITLHLNLAQDRQALPEDIRLVLFRIYQHSLANVLRHAQATQVNVRFAFDAEEAQLEVSDNGVGFEVPSSWIELVRQGHFGLAGAVERVALLDGTFIVDSAPGQGTTAKVILPIREKPDSTEEGFNL